MLICVHDGSLESGRFRDTLDTASVYTIGKETAWRMSTTKWRALVGVAVIAVTVGLRSAAVDLPDMDGVPTAEPETVGMSSRRLERLDDVMQAYIDRNETAGVVTLVARRGKVVHFSALGERDAESGAPMTHDAIFRIASMTKPIVSTALMMLYEEGRFQLRDPISKWLPAFADMEVAIPPPTQERVTVRYKTIPAARPITVQHILTHTAGLANSYRGIMQREFLELSAETKPGDTVGDVLERLARLPLNFHPGDAWEYGRGTDRVLRAVSADPQRDDQAVLADMDAVEHEADQIQVVEGRRLPRGQLRGGLGDKPAADGALTHAATGDVGRQRLQTSGVASGADAH